MVEADVALDDAAQRVLEVVHARIILDDVMARSRLLRPGAALALVLVLAGPAAAAPDTPAAPAFSARLLDEGRTLDSRALIGKKVVVLRFQASWCKVCTRRRRRSRGSPRRTARATSRSSASTSRRPPPTPAPAQALQATYAAALDPGARIANRFGFKRAPYTVVIDKKGEMVARITGSADEARLAKIIEPLLAP